jgi:hypothetical protein
VVVTGCEVEVTITGGEVEVTITGGEVEVIFTSPCAEEEVTFAALRDEDEDEVTFIALRVEDELELSSMSPRGEEEVTLVLLTSTLLELLLLTIKIIANKKTKITITITKIIISFFENIYILYYI